MDVVTSVAAKITEYTVAPIGRQVGYLLFYNDNLKELTDQVEELENARVRIMHLIETERRNGKDIEAGVQKWLFRVDKIIGEAKQICEDPNRAKLVGCSTWWVPNLQLRHQISRKAKKKATHVAELQGKGEFGTVGYLPSLHGMGSTSTARGIGEKLRSRKTMKQDIVEALKDPKLRKIGVYGLGGVGKTTLVNQVARKAKGDKLFDEVVMSTVSQNPDLERIQCEIAELLGLHFEERTVAVKAHRLRERIKKEKTILIILDDMWEKLDLEKLGIPFEDDASLNLEKVEIPFGDDYKGCKVLLISRTQDVLREMETQKDFRLEALNEQETWSLFRDMVGEIGKYPDLQRIAIEVAKKCAGLPVLIVTVARALKNKSIHEWKDALNQLARVDNKEMREITYSALELSYNSLETDEAKELFLLCGLLGPYIEYLLLSAMGLGICKHVDTVEETRNRLYRVVSVLKASCLFLEDDKRLDFAQMHDMVREVAISIASRDNYVFRMKKDTKLEVWPTENLLRRCPQIILDQCCIQQLPERLDCPELKFFLLNSKNNRYLEISNSFFKGMEKLQVLQLICLNMSSLPTSICSLTKLKTLCLLECSLENMVEIGALKNLEILSFRLSSMQNLPSEIGQLTHIRMLDLEKCGIEHIPPNIISSLTKLEELRMGNTFIKWEVENPAKQNKNASIAELRKLPNLTTLDIQIQEAWNLPRDLMFEKIERYQIVIGDVWEGFDKYRSSKILKLKLDTSIHLEHGIKTLIKRAEDLHLDEIGGISNILYQLNGEGFPLLKHLHVQNNANVQHIINSVEWNQVLNAFPILETLIIHSLNNLQKICHGPLAVNSFSKLRVIKVESCHQLKYLFSYSLVRGLSQLTEIQVSKCNSLKEIVLGESDSSDHNGITLDQIEFAQLRFLTLQQLPLKSFMADAQKYKRSASNTAISFFSHKVELPKLETLKLSTINLEKIWDDNLLSASNYMQHLSNLIVEDCGDLKYLFSSSMARNLKNLKVLQISNCHMMEEIIATQEGSENDVALQEVGCPKLQTIIINNMEKLKNIWHYQFGGLKLLVVEKCDRVMILFPSSTKGRFQGLESLKVKNCGSVEEIFQLKANESQVKESTTQLRYLTLIGLPKLKQIWSEDSQGIFRFQNLQVVHVESCNSLEYLFPLSTATVLTNLEKLNIWWCQILKEIVAKVEGRMKGPAAFVLNQLTTLDLRGLVKLTGFYSGNYTLACPTMKYLNVFNCRKLTLFKTESISSQEWPHHGGELHISIQQPLFKIEEVISNLEVFTLNSKNASMILQSQISRLFLCKLKLLRVSEFEDEPNFPVWYLQTVPYLEWLIVEHSSFIEIFGDEGQIESSTKPKRLSLIGLPELQHICKEGSHIQSVLQVLEFLDVKQCSNLKILVPSYLTFPNLTYLEVENCNGLKNLITPTTARSLGKLEIMKIKACNSLAEIVIEKEEETKDGIIFSSLTMLELNCLPCLRRFSSAKCFIKFPFLKEVVVRQCPRMKIFSEGNTSTPNLRKVRTEEKVEDWYWEGSLNGTIKKMFADMVSFDSFKHLKLSEYPELKDLWCDQLQNKMFNNLKTLVVQKCNFLSDVLFSSNLLKVLQNLEELEVRECDSLEAVFDVKGMNDKEMMVTETSQLKKLTLSSLPNLKHIWNMNPQQILSFGNLQLVKVVDCQSLGYVFSMPICQDLEHLEELDISSSGVKEIVGMEEESSELIRFHFPQLSKLRLLSLTKLKTFYLGRHTLECPALKCITVYHCEASLQTFGFKQSEVEQLDQTNQVDLPIRQALFPIERVCPNLERLTLNGEDVIKILNHYCQENPFQKAEGVCLQCFHETAAIFPIDFLERFPILEELVVRCSSFEKLFSWDEGTLTQVKQLTLLQLNQLKYIWGEDSQWDPVGDKLESSELNRAPSTIAFKNLTQLHVSDCKVLVHLITSSMVKSLVQLTILKVENCEKIENVVEIDEQEAEEEITFENLEYLCFTSLSRFRSFCSGKQSLIFPSLVYLVAKECPEMKSFSQGVVMAPFLTTVEVEGGKKLWKGDINNTIKHLFEEKIKASSSSTELSFLHQKDYVTD